MRLKQQRRLAAVVLARNHYREADLIVTFLTREMGLVSALARYGRRSVRRFGGGLLSPGVAAWYDFTFKPNIDLAFVERGEDNPRAARLPASPLIQSLAAFALELVRGFEAPGNPAEESFRLLVRHLSRLARTEEAEAARLVSLDFALKYMELAGFGPRLEGCLLCDSPPDPKPGWRWDPLAGGLYCPSCAPINGGRVRPIPENILSRLSPGETPPPPLSPADLSEAELFFEKLAERHLERPLKSMKAVRRLLKETADKTWTIHL